MKREQSEKNVKVKKEKLSNNRKIRGGSLLVNKRNNRTIEKPEGGSLLVNKINNRTIEQSEGCLSW